MKSIKHLPVFLIISFIFSLSVTLPGQIPVAVNDTVEITPTIPVTVHLLANDTITARDSIQYYFLGGFKIPLTATRNPDKTVTFLLTQWGFPGNHTFQYYIRDYSTNVTSNKASILLRVRDNSNAWLDINNVRARFCASGLHFCDFLSDSATYEVPKGSGKKTMFCNSFWIGGKDETGLLHLAGERYRQGSGNPAGVKHDYWAGPVSSPAGYNPDQDTIWNRMWKVSRADIEYHRNHFWEWGYQIPRDILEWPAHGNVSLGQSFHLAPFSDRNGDGIYDPLDGDYPEIRGDQALWFIYNDDHDYHSETTGEKLKVEIHGMAYAFDRPADTAFKNTTFLYLKVFNRSANTYDSTWTGFFTDIDLGYVNDDYLGCDPERGMFYGYNGKPVDGTGQPNAYGANPPMQAVVMLGGPRMDDDGYDNPAFRGANLYGPSFYGDCSIVDLDSSIVMMKYGPGSVNEAPFLVRSEAINGAGFGDGIADNERFGMRRFMYFNNANTGVPGYGLPYPLYAHEYYQVMLGIMQDRTKTIYGGNGRPMAGGYGPACDFMFPGLSDTCNWGTAGLMPSGPKLWTEKTAQNNPQDRRGNISSGPFTFHPGDVQEIDLAFVWAREYAPQDSTSALRKLNTAVDTIRRSFTENRVPGGGPMYGINYRKPLPQAGLKTYPNPVRDLVCFELPEQNKVETRCFLLSPQGKQVCYAEYRGLKTGSLDVSGLEPGLYILRVQSGDHVWVEKVVVEK